MPSPISSRRFRAALLLTVLWLCACITSPPQSSAPRGENQPTTNEPLPANSVDTALANQIDQLIDNRELALARWGISVIALKDNRRVYERNANKLFTPASNMKLFPTGIALELLGPDYRWRTSVYAAAPPDSGGTVNGDLVLYGRGAPDLVATPREGDQASNSLEQLANDLYSRGVRRIRGNVVGDASYFRGEPLGDGWQWNDLQWYFGAEASALSINNNETSINVLPAEKKVGAAPEIRVGDSSGYLIVENKMVVGRAGERLTLGVERGLSDNTVHVWGTFPPDAKGFGARISVHQPGLWAAKLFLAILKKRGIAVEGQALTRDAHEPASQRFDPQRATEIAFVSSKPLSEIIKITNKYSVNLYAELLLRTIGRERAELLSTPEPSGRERGDDEAGLGIIRLWLERAKVSTQGLALHDGSGLSRLNLVTPRSFSQLLAVLHNNPNGQLFRESLPLAGRDGTLGGRLRDHAERVSAKTGYLTYTTALSGYATTSQGEVFAFSILCNDETGRASSRRLIDQIVSLLVTYPDQNAEKHP